MEDFGLPHPMRPEVAELLAFAGEGLVEILVVIASDGTVDIGKDGGGSMGGGRVIEEKVGFAH